MRYGSVIGYAKGAIAKGSWVHEDRMQMPVAPSLNDLPLATAVPQPTAPPSSLRKPGDATIEEVGTQLFQMVLDVASGRKQTWADHWGLHNDLALFSPSPVT